MRRIFWVDDDEATVSGIKSILEDYGGFCVEKVTSYRAAKERIQAAADAGRWDYYLLILDVSIQAETGDGISEAEAKISGLRVHDLFREKFNTERVLILTNVPYRVPEHLFDGPYTVTRDKLEVAGLALLDVIRKWPTA